MDKITEPKRNQKDMPHPSEVRVGARNRRNILKAAIHVFSRKGFDGTRINEIAEQSGLPKANVYYYFESKEVIYRAVIGHLIKGWDDALDLIQPEQDPAEALEKYVRAKLEYTRRNGSESRLFASEIIRGAGFLTLSDRRHIQSITDRAVGVVEHWISEGRLKPVDARHLFILLWSATQYYGDFEPLVHDTLHVKRMTTAQYETAAITIVSTVLDGLAVQHR